MWFNILFFRAKICREVEVNAPASALWEVHSTLQLNDAVRKDYGHLYEKVEVLEGDGSAGTIVRFVFQPGVRAPPAFNEKFIKVDHETMTKEIDIIEGGFLDVGFERYFIRTEVIEKDEKSCITRSTIEYDLKDEFAANASLVSIVGLVATTDTANNLAVAKTN